MPKIIFTPGHHSNRWKLLALSPVDLISQAIFNSGSKSVSIVALEVWRIASLILHGVEPGELTADHCDDISDTLYDCFNILFMRDIEKLIRNTQWSRKTPTSIVIESKT